MAVTKNVKIDAKLLDGYKIEMKSGPFTYYIDQPEMMGGSNSAPTPLQYQFFSLGGCLVTIAKIVANQRGVELRGLSCEVVGGLNTKVLMGKEADDRAGFQEITVKMDIDADMTEEEKAAFIEEVDSRCPVSDNFANGTPVKVSLN